MTVEGERDDISGVGQTEATHRLIPRLPDDKKMHYLQSGVGHFGVFNGARFRSEIAPRISDFIQSNRHRSAPVTKRVAAKLVSSRRKAS